jgi:hypothetical protein
LTGTAVGSSKNANLGLNKINFLGYTTISQAIPAIANGTSYTFNSDPKFFGINAPLGNLTLSRKGKDKLIGSFSGFDVFDKANSTAFTSAKLTVTGGEGKFKNASGFGTVSGTIKTNAETLINVGTYAIDINIDVPKSVPESSNVGGILMGISGAFLLNKKLYA